MIEYDQNISDVDNLFKLIAASKQSEIDREIIRLNNLPIAENHSETLTDEDHNREVGAD